MQCPRIIPDDHNVQLPLNNFAKENQQEQEEEDEDINLVGETSQSTCLNLQEYEDQFRINLFLDDEDAHIHIQNDKNQAENQRRNYNLTSKGAIQ